MNTCNHGVSLNEDCYACEVLFRDGRREKLFPMSLTLRVTVSSVGSDSAISMDTTSPEAAIKFLDDYDHEGSEVSATVELTGEQVYKVLRKLLDPKDDLQVAESLIDRMMDIIASEDNVKPFKELLQEANAFLHREDV
jgi:hypothetical protein